jgi:hypothetical protein
MSCNNKELLKGLKGANNNYSVIEEGKNVFLDYKKKHVVGFIFPDQDEGLLKALLERAVKNHGSRVSEKRKDKKRRRYYDNRGYLK